MITEESDYFSLFGLPHHPDIDPASLEARYHELMRRVHPDLHNTGSAGGREISLRTTALITKAYRILNDPVERGRYWLEIHGITLGRDTAGVPQDVADDAFEIFDALKRPDGGEFLRKAGARLALQVKNEIVRLEKSFSRWTSEPSDTSSRLLDEMREALVRISYLSSLVRDIEKTLDIPPTPPLEKGGIHGGM